MKISIVWARIDALISIRGDKWKDTIKKLEAEGYKSKLVGRKANEFEKRLTKLDVDRTLRRPLRTGKGAKEVVKTVLEVWNFEDRGRHPTRLKGHSNYLSIAHSCSKRFVL